MKKGQSFEFENTYWFNCKNGQTYLYGEFNLWLQSYSFIMIWGFPCWYPKGEEVAWLTFWLRKNYISQIKNGHSHLKQRFRLLKYIWGNLLSCGWWQVPHFNWELGAFLEKRNVEGLTFSLDNSGIQIENG